ncbi:MAG: DNA translocase FtsK [Elusimicrobia bacterium]|nr:DNA translocase FtsK [Elusimicrobiota bacterium]
MTPRQKHKQWVRKRKKREGVLRSLPQIGVLLVFFSLVCLWCLLLPQASGKAGQSLQQLLKLLFGQAAWLFAGACAYLGSRLYRFPRERASLGKAALCVLLIASAAAFLSALSTWLPPLASGGGLLGERIFQTLQQSTGALPSLLLTALLFLWSLQTLGGFSWMELIAKAATALKKDYREWKRLRAQTRQKMPALPSESQAAAEPQSFPLDELQPDPPPLPAEKTSDPAPSAAFSRTSYISPPLELLNYSRASQELIPRSENLQSGAKLLESTLQNFGIQAQVTEIHPGPVLTRYELAPAAGVKIGSIVSLSNDIALAMKAQSVRIIAPIPGKGAVGIEIPNAQSALVVLRELLESPEFQNHPSPLAFALGKTVSGEPAIADLAPMPHLLIAGSTNSGKSVTIHSMILSWIYRASPQQLKLLLIDPKRLELPFYDGIPHLYDPKTPCSDVQVVTQPQEVARSLKALVGVMEHRYEKFSRSGVRNIESFNQKASALGEPPEFYIVVVIDELADLMLTVPKEIEDSIQRLAQMARAVGIHLVLSTQRPSVDVLTGVIKANLPARISLNVISKTDSRVILDCLGAENLLGKGDMLYLASEAPKPVRLQGAFVSDQEIQKVAQHLRAQGTPSYPPPPGLEANADSADQKVTQEMERTFRGALKLVLERKRVSQDLLKAHFGSSARATDLLSLLEVQGFIHKPEGSNRWEIDFERIETHLNTLERNAKLQN